MVLACESPSLNCSHFFPCYITTPPILWAVPLYWSTLCVCVFTCYSHGDVQQCDSYGVIPNPLLHNPGEHQSSQNVSHLCGNYTDCRREEREQRGIFCNQEYVLARPLVIWSDMTNFFIIHYAKCVGASVPLANAAVCMLYEPKQWSTMPLNNNVWWSTSCNWIRVTDELTRKQLFHVVAAGHEAIMLHFSVICSNTSKADRSLQRLIHQTMKRGWK